MAQKHCRKFQSPEQGARTLQTTDRQTDRRQTDGRTTTFAKKEEKKHSIQLEHREKWRSLRVETGIPDPWASYPYPTRPVRHLPVPDPYPRARVYPRVRVDPHTSSVVVTSLVHNWSIGFILSVQHSEYILSLQPKSVSCIHQCLMLGTLCRLCCVIHLCLWTVSNVHSRLFCSVCRLGFLVVTAPV